MPLSLNCPTLAPRSGIVKRIVLILHGYGADGDNLLGIAQMMSPAFDDTLWLAPNAPEPCEMGMGYQWFSLADRSSPARDKGVAKAAPILNDFIDALLEKHALTADDFALMGFSQGTMTSLYTALRRAQPLAGVVGFSGTLLGESTMGADLTAKPPVCLIHGDSDDVVPYTALAHAHALLEAHHVPVEVHTRPYLGHSIDEEGIEIAAEFLMKCFRL